MRLYYLPCIIAINALCAMELEEVVFTDIVPQPSLIVVTRQDMDAINPFSIDNSREQKDLEKELTRWAIHELIEQSEDRDKELSRNKKIMTGLGVTTGALSLTLVVCEIIKLWS